MQMNFEFYILFWQLFVFHSLPVFKDTFISFWVDVLSNMKFLFFPFFLIFFTLFLFPSNNFKKIFVHLHNTIS